MALILVLALGFALAYANGSNDVSKGVATLVGGGVTSYRRAILWGTLWTGAGAIAAAFLARAMIETFGSGLLAKGIHPSFSAALATVAGAALWVALSTIKRLPVSTTHAVVGSVAGVASVAYGVGGVDWLSLARKIALPLLLSPVVALAVTAVLLRIWRGAAPDMANDCVCAEVVQPTTAANGVAAMMSSTAVLPQLHITTCKASEDPFPRITLNHLHWLSSGATSFARGLNDAPKMAAILMSAGLLSGAASVLPLTYFVAIALGIVLGSWIAGRRVTEMLACDVTRMDHREGFVANLVTATLVGSGAMLGWPMSTTQVAAGAIVGIGSTGDEKVNRKTVRSMLIAWVVTLPGAALLGAAAFALLRIVGVH
ncbi:MAG TPA: inorganic phosphate transporter [Candidatus Acidoferrales bacterium]|nr:inorganic phosphate transporter [Candidatus Acidoferrales bacterium]